LFERFTTKKRDALDVGGSEGSVSQFSRADTGAAATPPELRIKAT
jgi:hypothetical protein